eukprot:2261978-Ditylum_brightwellii.AAC.1
MRKVVKCKLVYMAEEKFDLIEVLLEGNTLMQWLEFKHIETTCTNKNPGGSDTASLGVTPGTYKLCLQ